MKYHTNEFIMNTQEKNKTELILEVQKRRKERKRAKSRKKITALTAMLTVLTMIAGIVFTASAKAINITEINEFDGTSKTTKVYTMGGSVQDVLDKHELYLNETDRINMPVNTEIDGDKDIVITRGKEITIVVDGVESSAVVTKANAHDALVEAGYFPNETDEISVDSGDNLAEGTRIELVSVSNTEDIVNETIDNDVEYINDNTMPEGETMVVNEGQTGVREIKSSVIYRSGEEFYREVVSDTVTVEPRNRVIAVGTKKAPAPAPPVSEAGGGIIDGLSYSKKINMTATAYSTSPSENGGYTVSAMGNPLGYGIAAVDPSVIPLGSKVYVTSADGSWTYGYASAEDTGGAIKGNKIDLCYGGSSGSVSSFGRRSCVVYVLN